MVNITSSVNSRERSG
ncbi:hypothetical protein CP99DC5_1131A, partial [Chlamydia psittaci 99DC5]